MSLSEIPDVIDITSSKYCNFEFTYNLTDKTTNISKKVIVKGTSYLATLSRLETLVSNRIIIQEL